MILHFAEATGTSPSRELQTVRPPVTPFAIPPKLSSAKIASAAAVKLTELSAAGPYVNPDAAADWAYLKSNGLGRVGYLFGHPSQPVAATVALFGSLLAQIGLDDGDGVCLDHEVTDGMGPGSVAAWGRDVLSALRSLFGRPPLTYTFLSFAQAGNCAGMGGSLLWMADPSSPMGSPRVPAPWTTWAAHQWGQRGIDRDAARWASLTEMRAAMGKPQAAATFDVTADGRTALANLTAAHGTSPMRALKLTLDRDGGRFPDALYAYGNGVLTGKIPASAPLPAGTVIRVPSKPAP